MHIDEFVEGQRMELRRQPGERLPRAAGRVGCGMGLAVIASPFLYLLLFHPAFDFGGGAALGITLFFRGLGVVLLAALVLVLWNLRRVYPSPQALLRLRADAAGRRLDLSLRNAADAVEEVHVPFQDIAQMRLLVREDQQKPSQRDLWIELILDRGKAEPLTALTSVAGVDKRDEVLDFGRRLSSILGLDQAVVKSNEPRGAEFCYARGPDSSPPPAGEPSAEAAPAREPAAKAAPAGGTPLQRLYERNTAPKDQRLDRAVAETWDPKMHSFVAKVIDYEPERRLVYEDRFSLFDRVMSLFYPIIRGISLATLVFLGFFAAQDMGGYLPNPLWLAGIGTAIFVGGALLQQRLTGAYRDSVWSWDLAGRRLWLGRSGREVEQDLKLVVEVLVQRHKAVGTGGMLGIFHGRASPRAGAPGSTRASTSLVGPSGRIEVASTRAFGDPEQAYRHALAFAAMIANALDVPVRFEEGASER